MTKPWLDLRRYNKAALIEFVTMLLAMIGPFIPREEIKRFLEMAHLQEEKRLVLDQEERLRKRLAAVEKRRPDGREWARLNHQYQILSKRLVTLNRRIHAFNRSDGDEGRNGDL